MVKKTSIYEIHKKHGAKIVDFATWELPVKFSGLINEHLAVRSSAGIFDVSHMGEILISGTEAKKFAQTLLTNDINNLYSGKAMYTCMCYENGGIVDDLLIYMLSEEKYLLVVNASNTDKDFDWIKGIKEKYSFNVEIDNCSNKYFQIAVQGPKARSMFSEYLSKDLNSIKFFHFKELDVKGSKCIVSRTGYTGEEGFEIYGPWKNGAKIFDELVSFGFTPCGLGARDTLRLEAALMLYGNDISSDTTPLEAGINFCVKLNVEDDFIGKEALLRQKKEGLKKKLYGISTDEKGIFRHGYEIFDSKENHLGVVTSGTMSPSLQKPIGLAYINTGVDMNDLFVKIRKNLLKIKIVDIPFIDKYN